MKYLLDTNVFMWLDSDIKKVSSTTTQVLANLETVPILSIASIWEIQIKSHIGKLNLRANLRQIIAEQSRQNKLRLLPILVAHVLELDNLPLIHRDPFDRILIAQARHEGAILISADPVIAQYPVQVAW